jgi:hypothetical protein
MAMPATRDLIRLAHQAGYEVIGTDRPRPNRWILTLTAPDQPHICLLIQARPLVGAADVHDLAELINLRKATYGILLAYEGYFSPAAYQAHAERRDVRLLLCTSLPSAPANAEHVASVERTVQVIS